jgi:hypothetical protein
MAHLLLRLLLIVSLVTNGAAAPWAMAHAAKGSGHDHAAMLAQASSDEASGGSDCHHGATHADHTAMGHAASDPAAPSAPADRSCCDGPNCTCGCMLPPVLARFALNLPVIAWTAAPVVEPATRSGVRRALPLLRPPAT